VVRKVDDILLVSLLWYNIEILLCYKNKKRFAHFCSYNSSFGKRRIKHKCSVLWNSLPDHVKVCSTLKVFKKNIKKSPESVMH